MRARSNCIFVQLSISGRIHHHPHYLHSAPRTKLCYSIIETRESRCLKGHLLCSLPHCIPNAPASGIVDLHQIQALIATLPGHVTCALLLHVLFRTSLQAKKFPMTMYYSCFSAQEENCTNLVQQLELVKTQSHCCGNLSHCHRKKIKCCRQDDSNLL